MRCGSFLSWMGSNKCVTFGSSNEEESMAMN